MHGFSGRGHIVDVTRSDGKVAAVDASGLPHYFFNAIVGMGYTVRYRNLNSLASSGGVPQTFQMYMRNCDAGTKVPITISGLPVGSSWKWAVTECYTHRKLVLPTTKGAFSFVLSATAKNGSVANSPYPNQKVGYVLVKVCAHPTGYCLC